VSSGGGGGGVEFLPINSQLNKVSAGVGSQQRLPGYLQDEQPAAGSTAGCGRLAALITSWDGTCHLPAAQVMFYV
jgi:hypothetical protein